MTENLKMTQKANICVIGAGIIGLSTAVQIQKALPGARVTIIADKFDRDTTSDGAAGMFRPDITHVQGVDRNTFRKWSQDSWDHFHNVLHSPDASEAGVFMISGFIFYKEHPKEPQVFEDIVYKCRRLTEKDLDIFPDTFGCRNGISLTTLIVECRWYLPWLMKRFRGNGGRTEVKSLQNIEELAGKYDVVVNCAGLGNTSLVGDQKVIPNRGQIVRVIAPWVKHFVYVGENTVIIPGQENVSLGITRDPGRSDTEVDDQDTAAILERTCRVVPSLKKAKIDKVWAGLRPYRAPLRLEAEVMQFGQRTIQVVHNYGHAGHGVALSWGTAKHATQLVKTIVDSRMQKLNSHL